jgi:hypothetical protein
MQGAVVVMVVREVLAVALVVLWDIQVQCLQQLQLIVVVVVVVKVILQVH